MEVANLNRPPPVKMFLKQPYAELIVSGKKTIELRTWNTKFRGEFLIQASKAVNKEACERNKIDPRRVANFFSTEPSNQC